MTLANRLRECREALGFTQEETARKIGSQWQQVSRWERGEAAPRAKNLKALAEAYGVTTTWLKSGEGPKFPGPFRSESELRAFLEKGGEPGAAEHIEPYRVSDHPVNVQVLTRALHAALAFHPPLALEVVAQAAAEAYDTANRFHREEKVESIVKSLLE